jgi:chromosome partitioning protein
VSAPSSTYGVLTEASTIRKAVRRAVVPGVSVLGGHAQMATLDLALAAVQIGRELRLKQALSKVASNYDVALIDLGAARNLAWASAVVAADWLLVPTQLEAGAVDGTVQLVQGARDLAPLIGREIGLLGVIPTRVPVVGRTRESRALEAALRSHFPGAVTPVVHESPRAASALGAGTDLVTYAPESRAASDYAAIAAYLAKRLALPIDPAVILVPGAATSTSTEA